VDEADDTDESVDEVEDATDGCRVPVGRLAPELPARQDLRPAGQSDRCPPAFYTTEKTRHLPVLHVLDFDCKYTGDDVHGDDQETDDHHFNSLHGLPFPHHLARSNVVLAWDGTWDVGMEYKWRTDP
jgi:hypothetical protein